MTLILLVGIFLTQQAPNGSIAGRLSFADGTPVPGFQITVAPVEPAEMSPQRRAVTDQSGNYRLANLAPGRYAIRLGPAALQAPIVTVSAGSTLNGMDFTLPASDTGFRVSGRVRLPAEGVGEASEQTIRLVADRLARPPLHRSDSRVQLLDNRNRRKL